MPMGLLCPGKLQQNSTIQHVRVKYLEKRLFLFSGTCVVRSFYTNAL